MAIFKEFQYNSRDRSIEDRRRHKELVEKSIKDNIGNIISEESIIGQNKNKKIKIPIRGLKEYYFRYGKNQKHVGSGTGTEEKGKRSLKGDGKENDKSAGNMEGEDIYETEITVDEAIHMLFEDIDLPFLNQKNFKEIETFEGVKRWGVRQKGIPPRLSKKHTVIEKKKREMRVKRTMAELGEECVERIPFHEDDLKYFHKRPKIRRESNAVIICIMDTSGSMGHTKKYLARSFYFLMYQFAKIKYLNVEIAFVAHTTTAKEVSEDDFFHRGESGGTYISSGYEKALQLIEERYPPSNWNIYAFHCSDGDNWGEDNETAVDYAKKLCETCNLFGYGEIKTSTYTSTIMNRFLEEVKYPNFSIVKIFRKEDVWPAFVKMLQVEKCAAESEG